MADAEMEAPSAHDACTIAELGLGDALIWLAVCFCGWRSAAYEDEFSADFARLAHPGALKPASSGGLWGEGRADAAQLLLAGIAADRATLTCGLSEDELVTLEARLGFRFVADHRDFLSKVLPIGEGWPDWRASEEALRNWVECPGRELEAAVGPGTFWWDPWGPRPTRDADAVQLAHAQLMTVPRLVPLFENRYLPAMPMPPGSPVFSWYPGDVIVYASSLTDYLRQEFADARWDSHLAPVGEVPFWSALVRSDAAHKTITAPQRTGQDNPDVAVRPTGPGSVFCECCGYTVEVSLKGAVRAPGPLRAWGLREVSWTGRLAPLARDRRCA